MEIPKPAVYTFVFLVKFDNQVTLKFNIIAIFLYFILLYFIKRILGMNLKTERSGLLKMWRFIQTIRYYIVVHYYVAKFFKCSILPLQVFLYSPLR